MKQISIVAEAGPNVIADLIEAVSAGGVNIETLESETVGDTVVAILTVDLYDDALRALARAGYHAISDEALLIRLPDQPGALAGVAQRFKQAGVPLRSLRIIRRSEGFGIVALSTPRSEEALALVQDYLIA